MMLQVVRIDRAARELSKTPLLALIGPLLTEIETIVIVASDEVDGDGGSKSGSLIFWIRGTHFRVTTHPSFHIFNLHFSLSTKLQGSASVC
jgi:hypothetical protein